MNDQEAVVYSVYVGIDWADSNHDVCIQPTTSDELAGPLETASSRPPLSSCQIKLSTAL